LLRSIPQQSQQQPQQQSEFDESEVLREKDPKDGDHLFADAGDEN
jgi:hypothetical protein